MAQVHIVMGESGEYSDRREWPVLAYLDKDAAIAHVQRAEEWLLENDLSMASPTVRYTYERGPSNPHDSQMSIDYTGVRYYVMSVLLANAEGR